jgi:hypothetical protein
MGADVKSSEPKQKRKTEMGTPAFKTTEELYAMLTAPFPLHILKIDSSRGFDLTSIPAQYVIDRLNVVFGLFGWSMTGEYKDLGPDGVLYFGNLKVVADIGGTRFEKVTSSVGYSTDKKNDADAYKSAKTSCLSKCASEIGIGDAVFKGEVNASEVKKATQKYDGSQTQKEAIFTAFKATGVSDGEKIKEFLSDKLGMNFSQLMSLITKGLSK